MRRTRTPTRQKLAQVMTLALCMAPLLGVRCASSGPWDGLPAPGTSTDTAPTTQSARISDARRTYPLDSLATATVTVNAHTLRVWLAQDFDPRRRDVVQEGLMHVPTEEIADDQGMLFVFSEESVRGFWMRNTIAPLDIAFARMNGTIVKIWQMPPQTLRTFSSIEPAMFALELKQGTLARLGVKEGDRLEIPQSVFAVEVD